MAKTKPGHRIVVYMDPRMALEAIILNRLECIPKSRRQEWLRGLLVQGFHAECRVLRSSPERRTHRSATDFTQWLAGDSQGPRTSQPEPPRQQARVQLANIDRKPFATLGKVIG